MHFGRAFFDLLILPRIGVGLAAPGTIFLYQESSSTGIAGDFIFGFRLIFILWDAHQLHLSPFFSSSHRTM